MTTSEFIGARELARFLGLDYQTIIRALDKHSIPAVRVGRQWRIHKSTLEKLRHDAGADLTGTGISSNGNPDTDTFEPSSETVAEESLGGDFAFRGFGLDDPPGKDN